MSSSELFDMDCSSPVASTSAHPVAQRFLVDYAPPTHIKPIAVDQHPAPRRIKSPAQTTETQTTVSYISGDDNERIRRWLLATRQAFIQQTQTETDKAKSAFSDSEEDEDEESEEESISDESESSCDSESDSDRIFLQPRRHQQSSSSLPPHLHPRARQAPSPSPAAGKSKSSSPLPVFPRRRTAPGSVTAMMMSHLTAARPALPVVCLSEASGQVDISPSSSSQSYSPAHSHLRSESREQVQPCRSRWSSSCSIQQPRSQPSWYEDDEDDSLNVPALVEDDECAPASTSTRSIPIPIAAQAQFTVPRRARAQRRGRATQRNPIEFGNADAKFGLQSAFDDSSDEEFESDDEERQIIVEEEQWDEDYQSPPRRRALNAAKGHMDGQSFYNGWLSQYHNRSLVADDRA